MDPAFHFSVPLSNNSFTRLFPSQSCQSPKNLHQSRLCTSPRCVAEPPVRKPITINTPAGPEVGFKTAQETPEPLIVPVKGKLPSYLHNTTYYRNGPGRFDAQHSDGSLWEAHNWFDSLALINSFSFNVDRNTVTYRGRYVGQTVLRSIESVPKDEYNQMAAWQPEPTSLLERVTRVFGKLTRDPATREIPINTPVTVERIPGRKGMTARTELNVGIEFDRSTLEETHTYSVGDCGPMFKKSMSCSHGMLDENTGEYFNFVYNQGLWKVPYRVYCIDKDGKSSIIGQFFDHPYFIHSFSLTDNYVILILWPCQVNIGKLLYTKNYVDSLELKERPVRFVVVSRKTKKVVANYYHDKTFFCFHTINAFEEQNCIKIDLSYYKDLSVFDGLRLEKLKKSKVKTEDPLFGATPVRFTLENISEAIKEGPEARPKVTARVLADINFDLATIAPTRERKPYRYAYGISFNDDGEILDNVTKVDIWSGRVKQWKRQNVFTGEPRFIPDPASEKEDDGCLLVQILDVNENKSALLVLDARTMKEICRATIPMSLPHGFHGIHVPSE